MRHRHIQLLLGEGARIAPEQLKGHFPLAEDGALGRAESDTGEELVGLEVGEGSHCVSALGAGGVGHMHEDVFVVDEVGFGED